MSKLSPAFKAEVRRKAQEINDRDNKKYRVGRYRTQVWFVCSGCGRNVKAYLPKPGLRYKCQICGAYMVGTSFKQNQNQNSPQRKEGSLIERFQNIIKESL